MRYLLSLSLIVVLSQLSCSDNPSVGEVTNDKMAQFTPKDSSTQYFAYDTTENKGGVLESWAAEVLFSLKEPVLSTYSGEGEFIRFVWLRAFENPIVIRANKFNDTIYASIKELAIKSAESKATGIMKDTVITLDKNKWNEFITPINQSGFWNASYSDTSFGKDGATWFLECRLNNQYKVIQRWDDGYFSSQALKSYLSPLVNFGNDYIPLKSTR
jgi:hypothetical protein